MQQAGAELKGYISVQKVCGEKRKGRRVLDIFHP
jgi:hypothetical protein